MRFPCLVLDHDDTVVNSTAVIHFPSFLAYLAQVRPGLSYTLDDYFRKNFDPGIIPLFKDELGFTDEELEGEYQFWQNWVATRVPEAYPGMREILERYKARGGKIIAVCARGDRQVSRSADYVIEVPVITECLMPVVVSVPLQLLAYYIAVYKGRNVDQPRNLAKSVTVE